MCAHGGVHAAWALNGDVTVAVDVFCPHLSALFIDFCSKIPRATSFPSLAFPSVCLPFVWLARGASSPRVQSSCQDTGHEEEFRDFSKSLNDCSKSEANTAPALHKAAQYIKRLFIMWRVCSWTRLDGDFRCQQMAPCQLALQSKYSSGSAILSATYCLCISRSK